MIDRRARDILAELGRPLTSGCLSTGRFEARLPLASDDPAVEAIWEAFDSLYRDLVPPWSHRLRGRRRVRPITKLGVARCVVFLHSDLEWSQERDASGPELRPFRSHEELQVAKTSPRLLSGA